MGKTQRSKEGKKRRNGAPVVLEKFLTLREIDLPIEGVPREFLVRDGFLCSGCS